MRRYLPLAAVSWTFSALLHGTSLVALGLVQGDQASVGASRSVNTLDVTVSFSHDTSPRKAVHLASYHELSPAATLNVPLLLNSAKQPDPAPPEAPPPRVSQPLPTPPQGSAIVETQLFGVRGRGNRFVYVFDRSSSMEGAPLAAAKRELLASLASLTAANQFQILFYNQNPQPMPGLRGAVQMTPADDFGKRQAVNFIGSVLADGSTDHTAALRLALAMRPDVLFLLTDANDPRLSPAELLTIRQLNRHTAIHTIEFGVGPSPLQTNFLTQLAMENGGQHIYIDVTLLQARGR